MPRASASAKRQQGASSNQRDTRHENGLVGPGKRVPKQKSQNQLNGTANPKSASSDDVTATPVPSTPPHLNAHGRHVADMSADQRAADALRRGSVGAYSESSSGESFARVASDEDHRRIDVNATKNFDVHRDTGPFSFALTVLRSCPLQDTIAILIILMQIPPIALSGIYVLFTLLTFVTTSNGLTLSEVFEWNLGAPSVGTVLLVDGIVLLVWILLWGPIQRVILDLAQMVIALGLGGGSRSRDGGSMKNSLVCLGMILTSHVLRHTTMKYSPIGYLLGSSRFLSIDVDDPISSFESIRGYDRVRSGWVNSIRSILAIHILTQGTVKWIRDWYMRRERRDCLAQTSDPEAGKPFSADPATADGFTTPDSDAVSCHGPPPPSVVQNSKKKRKQSAQIRNRQPLWAAIASTKIVVVKEYELSHNTADSAGSNATDIHNLGNAPFNTQPEQIWVSFVGCDEVSFTTSDFPTSVIGESDSEVVESPHVDTTMPFYVRVNNAVWKPTRVEAFEPSEDEHGRLRTCYRGEVYGLRPMSNYDCEFVSTTTNEVLFTTSVRTTQAKTADIDGPASKSNAQRSLRPESATTTLKTSIADAESKLAEERTRHKALRKDWHRKTNATKKENEKLSAAVQSAGTGDDKLRQKIQQNTTQQKQAEQAAANLDQELRDFEVIPESLKAAWKAKQAAYNGEKSLFDKAHAAYKSYKASIQNQVKLLVDEKASLEAKRTKINSRIAKVDGEHARITDANARGWDEAQRRRQIRADLETSIATYERELVERVNSQETHLAEKERVILALKAQLDAFNAQQQFFYAGEFDPGAMAQLAPGSGVPSQNLAAPYDANSAWNNSAYNASLWGTGPSPLAPGFVPQSSPLSQVQNTTTKSRGRSSSMLSDVSGFTQSSTNEDDASAAAAAATMGPAQQATFSGFSMFHPTPPPGFGYSPRPGPVDAEVVSDASESRSGGSTGSESAGDPNSPCPQPVKATAAATATA